MKRILLSAVAAASLLAPLACDLEKTGNQLTADHVMVGTLLATPQVDVCATAFAGYDAGTAGCQDGGIDVISLPAQTAAFVFFGTKSGANATPEGVANATVTLQPVGGEAVPLTAEGSGSYSRTSNGESELVYQSGATYQFIAATGGTRYVGQVDNAPTQERIEAFHPQQGYVSINANQDFGFDRAAAPSGQDRTLGFVTVLPLSADGEKGEPTYSNVPTTPMEFLQMVAVPGTYREARVNIPGSAFPQSRQTYLIIFQAVRSGGAESDNLFLGSALLAGTAEVGVVRTN